jgi:N-acetylglucosaminyldiphosphoundecaprenol N-acetyl-beta-D-mannosaminyltransferase
MQIFWIKLNKLKYNIFLEKILTFEEQNIVFTPNPEILLKTKSDLKFKWLLEKATFLTPDWIGLYIAFQILDNHNSKFLNTLLLPYYFFNLFFRRKYLYKIYWDRVCGSDLTKDLVKYSEKNNIKITIIDLYNPSDLNKVKSQKIFPQLLKEKFSKLEFEYYIYSPKEKENIIKQISDSDSKILFSTLWMKKQEQSVIEIMWKAKNIKLWLWIGSSFDYFIWFQKRAPKIWRQLWIEWLYRLLTWPKKIDRLKRLYKAIFVFTYTIIKQWKKQ